MSLKSEFETKIRNYNQRNECVDTILDAYVNYSDTLEARLKEAEEVIRFYGDRKSYSIDYGDDGFGMRSHWILYGDAEEINEEVRYAGRRAREYKKKWGLE